MGGCVWVFASTPLCKTNLYALRHTFGKSRRQIQHVYTRSCKLTKKVCVYVYVYVRVYMCVDVYERVYARACNVIRACTY